MKINLYRELKEVNSKPKAFEFYTTLSFWNDEHISKKMLEFHLNEDLDLASRNKAFVRKSLDWLVSKFRISPSTKICDFGCGPGLYTTRFAEEGAQVTGVDVSKRSLDYAKEMAAKMNLEIEYVLEDYLNFTTNQQFDLITMIFCDFSVLSPTQRKILLKKFYEYLSPDGYIVFDVHSLDFFNDTRESSSYEYIEKDGFWSQSSHFVFQNNFKYEKEKLILHKYNIFEEKKVSECYNWLQCYSIESITNLLRENGLMVVESYSNVAGDSYKEGAKEIAIVARKL